MQVVYRLLGPLEADVDGREARLGGPKQRSTLALMLCHPGTVVPASRLTDGLWGEDPPASAANLVQGYVSGLRKALGRDAIETRGSGYVVRVAPDALDLQQFEGLAHDGIQRARAGRCRARRAVPSPRRWGCGAVLRSPISRTSLRWVP